MPSIWGRSIMPNHMQKHPQIAQLEGEKLITTFLPLTSELGASVGSGIKLAMIPKNMTPPKNCTTDKFYI